MWSVCKKELRQFFSSLTGYIAIIVFLLVNGVMLFVFENNILDFGYATLDRFFQLAPWILLLLIPAITMRSFAEEFKTGTFEILQTRPLSRWQIVFGKYFGSLIVVIIALLPTIIYYFSVQQLSSGEGIDAGTIGLLSACIFASSTIGIAQQFHQQCGLLIISPWLVPFYYGFSVSLCRHLGWYTIILNDRNRFSYRSISRGVGGDMIIL
jgi:ABC-2 type transport system permease protein